TLSGNPLAMAAGLTTLKELGKPGVYESLEQKGAYLEENFRRNAQEVGIPCHINRVGSMMSVFFTAEPVVDFASAKTSDTKRFARFFQKLLDLGVFIAPSQFEGMFISTAHTQEDLEKTVEAQREA